MKVMRCLPSFTVLLPQFLAAALVMRNSVCIMIGKDSGVFVMQGLCRRLAPVYYSWSMSSATRETRESEKHVPPNPRITKTPESFPLMIQPEFLWGCKADKGVGVDRYSFCRNIETDTLYPINVDQNFSIADDANNIKVIWSSKFSQKINF